MAETVEPCPICGGRGCLEDEEPEDYIDKNGNIQIRFNKTKIPCPNCWAGKVKKP